MNFRTVLRAYSILRQLTDDESALLETLRAMNDTEREMMIEALSPQKPSKKTVLKSSAKGTKSKRASSLAEQIKTAGKPHLGDGPVCTVCAHTEDYEDHFKPSPHYHPFQPPASSVPGVAHPSSTNGGAGNGTVNSETGLGAAGVAAGGSSE